MSFLYELMSNVEIPQSCRREDLSDYAIVYRPNSKSGYFWANATFYMGQMSNLVAEVVNGQISRYSLDLTEPMKDPELVIQDFCNKIFNILGVQL